MNPLSIISSTGAFLRLLTYERDLVELAREIHRSPDGATKCNEWAASFVSRSKVFSESFLGDIIPEELTDDDMRLIKAAHDCEMIGLELEVELLKLKRANGKKSVLNSGYLAMRSLFAKSKIKEWDARLARCEGQMTAHMLFLTQ